MTDKHIIVMNFSHIYEQQEKLKRMAYKWMDCSDIRGTNCYLDEEAKKELVSRMKPFSPNGIHFIDSGNYHYVSKLWTDKIKEPFSLVLFDHHTDMQTSLFEELLSCGCWVKEMLDTNPYLKKVVLVGPKEGLTKQIDQCYKQRIVCYSENVVHKKMSWHDFSKIHLTEPVYISVDKDVLDKKSVVTNWDQGTLTLTELEDVLHIIMEHEEVIGIDICGESDKIGELGSSYVNTELATFIKNNYFGGESEKVSNY